MFSNIWWMVDSEFNVRIKMEQEEKRERNKSQEMVDLLLEALRAQPLYRHDLVEMFNFSNQDLNNFMYRLKKHNLIEIYQPDINKHANMRRWYKTERTESYIDIVKESKQKTTEALINGCKGEVKFSPHANPLMCKTSMSYHTSGNRTKVSAWSGYTSMAGL